jgi:hypothetical protein
MTEQGGDPAATEAERATAEIQLLLVEYGTLRAEVMQRVSSRMSLTAFLTASIAIVLSIKHEPAWVYGLAGGLLAVALTLIWVWSWCCIERLSVRLLALEKSLNDRARTAHGTDSAIFKWECLIRAARGSRRWHKPWTWC